MQEQMGPVGYGHVTNALVVNNSVFSSFNIVGTIPSAF